MQHDQKRLSCGSSARRAMAVCAITAAAVLVAVPLRVAAQIVRLEQGATSAPAGVRPTVAAPTPPDYVIGPDDVLTVVFWRDKDLTTDATVRPDGKISLPLINEIQAAGLTPEEFRVQVAAAAAKYVADPTVSVVVKAINSRKVFITGQVSKPGQYALAGPTTVLQLIALAGGLQEFADSKNITIVRVENGRPMPYRFNYREVSNRKNLKQNIELKPGDTIVVP
jgi:polysaccharide biosynthesis/export protein